MPTLEDMKQLNEKLKQAANAYYNTDTPIMTDKEYDFLYDALINMEKDLNVILPDSMTHTVGYTSVSSLPKDTHEHKALSLGKTKNPADINKWADHNDIVMSWKMDGITLVLTYDKGKLTKCVTRGNGSVGDNVTHNAPYIKGIPLHIPYEKHLVVRGEGYASYKAMEKLNHTGNANDPEYKIPRSLASGSIRKLNSAEMKDRGIEFAAFELVTPHSDTFEHDLKSLIKLGFNVVPFKVIKPKNIQNYTQEMGLKAPTLPYPVDGLVFRLNDHKIANTRGSTDKHPNYAMAFKWADETYPTTVRDIQWNASRTGRITPTIIFDTVNIDGADISRATGNNLSFLEEKQIGIGSVVTVYRSNMVIPQVDKVIQNPQQPSYPQLCPSCGYPTNILTNDKSGSKMVFCENPDCIAKHLDHFTHFVSRDAMNIVGLATNTLQTLIDNGFIHNYLDIYDLKNHPEVQDLIGKKTYLNLINSIENSRTTTLDKVIYSLGITGIGRRASKDISKKFHNNPNEFVAALHQRADFTSIDGIGLVTARNIWDWFSKQTNYNLFLNLLSILNIQSPEPAQSSNTGLNGKTFVVTGKVYQFKNRNELSSWVEQNGGVVASSVTKNTDYLINNDTTSTSGKNKKAKDLGIPIISEEDLLKMI